jgi:hypothetical protein
MKEAKAQQLASATNGATHEHDQLESGHAENGHADLHDEVHDHGDDVQAVDEVVENVVENVVEVSPDPDALHVEVPDEVVVAVVVDDVPQVGEPEVHVEPLVEESSADENVKFNGSLESQAVAPATEETAFDVVPEPPAVGNDIEDMVIMLQSVSISKPRPQSIVSIPDEHGEIPDEEQS